jgi:epoxyqueuosine reductase
MPRLPKETPKAKRGKPGVKSRKREMDLVSLALKMGADVAGLASARKLREQGAIEPDLLPAAETVIVIASAHSRTALASRNLQVKQYDAITVYENVRGVGDRIVKKLEAEGYEALSIPAFIPIDMADGKFGMVGAVDHRAAAVEAGIGSYGKSGLLLTGKFGPRVRLGCVLTSWKGEWRRRVSPDHCVADCVACLEGCPAGALLGDGKIDKPKCARKIFDYGLRRVIRFVGEMAAADPAERDLLLNGFTLRELWQNFMTGNYYYCFECQNVCPVGAGKKKPG